MDLDGHRVVDLLPDRESSTLAAWPRDRPGVEVVARDRANAYARAAGEAALDAAPGAGRWHPLKNDRDATRRAMQQRSAGIRLLLVGAADKPTPPEGAGNGGTQQGLPNAEQSMRQGPRSARFGEARRRHRAGGSLRGIARARGLHYRTVERYARSDTCPDWRPGRRGPSRLDRFAESLGRRRREGRRITLQIRRELLAIPSLEVFSGHSPGP